MKAAIKTLQDNDEHLIESKCSERAQVHWLAIYFQKELEKKNYSFDNKNGYCIDVEYNRLGLTEDTSKRLFNICDDCKFKEKCSKCKHDHDSTITIDMILHRRGKNESNDNVLCVEMKPKHISTSDKKVRCDKTRVEALCSSSDTLHQPYYQYGLALHLISTAEYKGIWYENGNGSLF